MSEGIFLALQKKGGKTPSASYDAPVTTSPAAQRNAGFVPASRAQWLVATAAFLLFVILSIGDALTRCPWWDEGMCADVAMTVRNFCHMGSSLIAPYGFIEWPGVQQYTYWQLPLYMLALGGWFRLVPPTLLAMRLFSLMWGCIFLASWFAIVRSVSRNEVLALLVCSAVGLDYVSITTASDGRTDMMCAGLGLAALAWYLSLRESNWSAGLLGASCLAAASLFCHPMGVISSLWLAGMVGLDWRRIKWGALAWAALPYMAGLFACLYYIQQAPDIFKAQSRAVAEYRGTGVGAILFNILNDFPERYLRYGFWQYPGFDRLKFIFLIFPVIGIVGVLADRSLRTQPLSKRLIIMALIAYVAVAVIDNQKYAMYEIYLLPTLIASGALWVHANWDRGLLRRTVTCGLLAASIMATIAAVAYRIRLDRYHNPYSPAVATIRSYLPPNGVVMGGSELGFALGFGPPLVDDRYLGYLSGKRPDVFVVNEYYGGPMGHSPRMREAWQVSRMILKDQYHLVFDNAAFKIYVPNDATTRR